ncbi:acetyl-CoA synthetase-like protein [Cystobasidium minutum MCA 4210]|uniref:acetyl-CoA synthetase-like protein n=1 Tax=Cystobasidium minutum MCA 4210 TaxID=1397322 RepID=UPI0034CF2930|eukprot:jgi/Rhomi1/209451/estExt_Genemark1.C_3_t10044
MIDTAHPCKVAPELTVPEFLESNPYYVEPDTVVYVDSDTGDEITWQQYIDFSKRLATGLRRSSLQAPAGSRIMILSPNQPHYPMVYIGVMGAGLVPAPASPAATASEVAAMMKLVKPFAVIVHPSCRETATAAVKLLPESLKPRGFIGMTPDSTEEYGSIFSLVDSVRDREILPFVGLQGRKGKDTLALVPFSSGTTGAFKGVMLSHTNIISNVLQLRQGWADYWEAKPRSLSFLADYHSYSHTQICIVNPVSGMLTVRMPKFHFENFLQAIERYKVQALPIVPPVAVQLAKNPLTAKYDLSSINRIMIAAAPTKPEICEILACKYKSPILQSFGCTEVSPTSIVLPAHMSHHQGSVGKLLPGMQCRLVDPITEELVDFNKEGEFQYKGPNVMMGYYGNPQATREAFTADGWLRSGDVGYRNKDMLYWCTDRIKELIKVRGFQVSPAELEGILLSHEKVIDAAVNRGIAEDTELPVAFVIVKPEHRNEAVKREIHAHVNKSVTYYKQLAGGIIWVDDIPKNPSGKILRRLLPVLQLSKAPKYKL